jgi:hypothetical protein
MPRSHPGTFPACHFARSGAPDQIRCPTPRRSPFQTVDTFGASWPPSALLGLQETQQTLPMCSESSRCSRCSSSNSSIRPFYGLRKPLRCRSVSTLEKARSLGRGTWQWTVSTSSSRPRCVGTPSRISTAYRPTLGLIVEGTRPETCPYV